MDDASTAARPLAEIEADIKSLQSRVNNAYDELADARRALAAAESELTSAKTGVRVGSVVVKTKFIFNKPKGHDGEYRVARIEGGWVYGNKRTKNGGWSKAERCLFSDWELAPATDQARAAANPTHP